MLRHSTLNRAHTNRKDTEFLHAADNFYERDMSQTKLPKYSQNFVQDHAIQIGHNRAVVSHTMTLSALETILSYRTIVSHTLFHGIHSALEESLWERWFSELIVWFWFMCTGGDGSDVMREKVFEHGRTQALQVPLMYAKVWTHVMYFKDTRSYSNITLRLWGWSNSIEGYVWQPRYVSCHHTHSFSWFGHLSACFVWSSHTLQGLSLQCIKPTCILSHKLEAMRHGNRYSIVSTYYMKCIAGNKHDASDVWQRCCMSTCGAYGKMLKLKRTPHVSHFRLCVPCNVTWQRSLDSQAFIHIGFSCWLRNSKRPCFSTDLDICGEQLMKEPCSTSQDMKDTCHTYQDMNDSCHTYHLCVQDFVHSDTRCVTLTNRTLIWLSAHAVCVMAGRGGF